MSSLAWIVLGLIAGFFGSGFGSGASPDGVIDLVLGSALLLVVYAALSRDDVSD